MTTTDRGGTRAIARTLAAALWLAGVAGTDMVVASGGNIGFLKDAPITRFTGPDLERFQSNLRDALEQNADGDTRRWENPDTGSAGDITVLMSFAQDGKRCRRVRIGNRARGYAEARTDAVFCKHADGRWKVLSQPPPAGATDRPTRE